MWIHEYKNWSAFTWDIESLSGALAKVRHQQGRLLGRMEGLGFDLRTEACLSTLTHDVVKSSAIEGEILNAEEVRSSIARRLGIELPGLVDSSRDVDGIVAVLLDATQHFSVPLTKERLFDWHAALFPTGRSGMHRITVGDWRPIEAGPMQVVSGAIGKETVHFEAPSADKLDSEMNQFLDWFESSNNMDPVIKAGIAHFWFVTVHPFEDGNGRIGRAICDMALARSEGISERFYSLSYQIEKERKQYYNVLERQQKSSADITPYLKWFLECFGRAMANVESTLSNVMFKAKLWDEINVKPVNERQKQIINRMLQEDFVGHMNTSKYATLTKCSTDTALRDIQDLKDRGVFIQNPSGGRSTSYRLPKKDEYGESDQRG